MVFDYLFDPERESDWGAGLQRANPNFPLGATVAVLSTSSVVTTSGDFVLVAQDEVGTVTREGAARILVRLDRRRNPVSAYFPTQLIEAISALKPEGER